MTGPITIGEIKSLAIDRLEAILDVLCPGGRSAGGNYTPRNPTRDDRNPGSFVIRLSGARRGSFVEYLNPAEEKGDIIDLVSYCLCRGAPDFKSNDRRGEAIRWLSTFLGVNELTGPARAMAYDSARRRQKAAAKEDTELEQKRQRAVKMWTAGRPIEGSAVERYLARRGLPLAAIKHREDDLRYLPAQEYWLERERAPDGRTTKPGRHLPAMAAAMRDGHDVIRAVHFTFLTEDGEKADVPKPKLIWPNFKGAVIRLSKGAAGRSVIQATEAGEPETVVVTEGIEDALTVALVSVLRCWAAGSIANIGNAPVLPFIEAWVIHRQNDVSPAAIEAFDRAKRALENTGRLVGELRAHGGKDINDQLRGRPATTLK